jgi:exopolysaccharide biosynthesis polyprenyl glycosylphosphotransferase
MKQTDLKIAIIEKAFQWIDGALLLLLSLAFLDKITISSKMFCSPDALKTFLSDFIQIQGLSLRQWILLLLSLWLWNAVLRGMGMYRYFIIMEEELKSFVLRILVSITVGLVCLSLLLSTLDLLLNSSFPVVQNVLTSLGTWTAIFIIYRITGTALLRFKRNFRQYEKLPHTLIAGVNKRSLAFAKKINSPIKRYFLLGYADHDTRRALLRSQSNAPLLFCAIDNIEEYISKYRVDILFIMLPLRGFYDTIADLLKKCKIQGVEARLVNDFFDLPFIQQGNLEEESFLDCDFKRSFPLGHDLKRLLDLVFSLFGLLFLLPVFGIIALALYIDDGWPIFFIQERVGLNKRRFKMWKFRTMVKDAEQRLAELEALNEVQGAAFKLTEDPRVTKLGKFLRKTSLDELPQLFNVVQGNMSLVGPRPLPIRDFKLFYKNQHRRRFSVKPGITGRWQVEGRSDVDFEEWMALDLEYIDNWKLFDDIEILFKTVIAVARCKGAK